MPMQCLSESCKSVALLTCELWFLSGTVEPSANSSSQITLNNSAPAQLLMRRASQAISFTITQDFQAIGGQSYELSAYNVWTTEGGGCYLQSCIEDTCDQASSIPTSTGLVQNTLSGIVISPVAGDVSAAFQGYCQSDESAIVYMGGFGAYGTMSECRTVLWNLTNHSDNSSSNAERRSQFNAVACFVNHSYTNQTNTSL